MYRQEFALHPNECNGGDSPGALSRPLGKKEREEAVETEWIRSNMTMHGAPRIRSHSEPIKHLPKHRTRSFSSPSPRIPLLYLIQPLESFMEQLFLQNDPHGDKWMTVDGRQFYGNENEGSRKVCTRELYIFYRIWIFSVEIHPEAIRKRYSIQKLATESGTQIRIFLPPTQPNTRISDDETSCPPSWWPSFHRVSHVSRHLRY
jgi:hypothetical protein